jgi:biuret amidohydrolase
MQAIERVDGLEIPQTLVDACHPQHLALVVYDMQIGVLRQIDDGEAVTRRVREVLQAARTSGVRTVFVRQVTMSAFEGTPLDIVLRDCGVSAVAVVGVALEIGIEPTVRHAADLGYVPIVVTDTCGTGDRAAGARSLETLRFAGDTMLTDVAGFAEALAGHR